MVPVEPQNDVSGSSVLTAGEASCLHATEPNVVLLSGERYRTVLEAMDDAVHVKDLQGRYIVANSEVSRRVGRPPEELIGRTAADLYPREIAERAMVQERQVIETGMPVELEEEFVTRERARFCHVRRVPLRSSSGEVVGVVTVSRDLTERKRAEEALARFRLGLERSHEAVFMTELDGTIVYCNPAFEKVYGYSSQEVLGKTPRILKSGSLSPETYEAFWKMLLDKQPVVGEIVNRTRDGRLLNMESAANPILGDDGRLLGFLAIQRDVTEQRRAEKKLRESEERFRLLAEHARDMIFRIVVDPRLCIEYVSPAVKALTGRVPEDLYADPSLWLSLVHPEDRQQAETLLTHPAPASAPISVRWVRDDASVVWTELSTTPICDDAGRLIAVEGIARDTTNRVKAEASLQEANERLSGWVKELEHRNREANLLNEMGELLQSCLTVEEAYDVTAHLGRRLFPGDSGAIFALSASKNLLDTACSWGDVSCDHGVFSPNECWALRSGRLHEVGGDGHGLPCRYLTSNCRGRGICVPLQAHGDTLGVFHVYDRTSQDSANGATGSSIEAKRRLVVSVADHTALALASLKLRQALRDQAIHDPVTGLFNRRYLEETIERELQEAWRREGSVAIAMLDVDHFKRFNDCFGHEAGDELLVRLGSLLTAHLRSGETACRYGGEEFALVLPGADSASVQERAEDLRVAVKTLGADLEPHPAGQITVSLGIAAFPKHGGTGGDVLRAADAALHRAKAEGRDRVVVAD